MRNTFSLAFGRMMERPLWQQWALWIAGGLCLLSLLYLMMLKTPLQQRQQGLQDAVVLRKSIADQQRDLLVQPSLNGLLQQQALVKLNSSAGESLIEKIAGPLRQSAGTLLQWQPETSTLSPVTDIKNEERGSLIFSSDFNGLLALLRELLNDPAAPVVRQLQLQAEKSLLHITLSLAAEPFYSPTFATLSVADSVNRDPFSAQDIDACPDNADIFRDVILGGVISDAQHQQGWMLWPGRGWQQAAVGWRDDHSGWEVVAVENGQIRFNLQRASCAGKQHTLALTRQSGSQSIVFQGEGK